MTTIIRHDNSRKDGLREEKPRRACRRRYNDDDIYVRATCATPNEWPINLLASPGWRFLYWPDVKREPGRHRLGRHAIAKQMVNPRPCRPDMQANALYLPKIKSTHIERNGNASRLIETRLFGTRRVSIPQMAARHYHFSTHDRNEMPLRADHSS